MRTAALISIVLALAGCGVESAGTAATVGKLQAEQAKQGKQQMETFKANLDAATKATEESAKRAAEEANKN
ncbi:hypothetical protein [Propionivibrio sp.]|uniref:hypothetical protein n=1 Tax=Propionivibrio sp. TaxID=2212460 RepID=UPI0025EC6F9C|nr:hypothetical protein [Propionivibrio sp.]MBK7356256.1 hypothetical protein [Propionivibrio sp.]MBK8746203.1 hypothetical protein [Propionivibrio sp.]